jgi:archaeosortase A (PGF-CTERM-specific)
MIPVISPGPLTNGLAVTVLAMFAAGLYIRRSDELLGKDILVGGWVVFAIFWGIMTPYFFVEAMSIIEGVLSLLAVPACLYTAYLLNGGRDSVVPLSSAVVTSGVIILGVGIIPGVHDALVESVTRQIEFVVGALGYDSTVIRLAEYGNTRTTFFFEADDGHPLTFTIRMACTGVGSIAIISGLIAAAPASLMKKARALAIVVPVIYGLNLVRTVFIAITFGYQKLQFAPGLVMGAFGTSDPYLVSYLWADRVISQSLSVVVLVVLVFWLVRVLPELVEIVEELLYIITRTEYDLSSLTRDQSDDGLPRL